MKAPTITLELTEAEFRALHFWTAHGLAGLENDPSEFDDLPGDWADLTKRVLNRGTAALKQLGDAA